MTEPALSRNLLFIMCVHAPHRIIQEGPSEKNLLSRFLYVAARIYNFLWRLTPKGYGNKSVIETQAMHRLTDDLY